MVSHIEPDLKSYERERVVFEAIKSNPNLHHNALLKQIVPQYMAKTTFEKTRDSLLEKEIIFVKKQGNMKFYFPEPDFEIKFQHRIEQKTNNSFHNLKLQLRRLSTDYPHKDINEKILLIDTILKNLIFTDNGFTFLDSMKNPKKTLYRDEHLLIQQLFNQLFQVIRKDKDFGIVFPTVMSNLVQLTPQKFTE
ncbi:hypothetical protein [Nitrosopumilus sp.]|uniref:hypothetical protein n=1 Tax=Nitrosopumilus sp. TaxID=2024843 RepID=UPI00247E162D|nr:hypothetical protein [Nitrosopumilus sp.]MCV0429953.1 hypothetical protein [Nitrosopumilus sp.]